MGDGEISPSSKDPSVMSSWSSKRSSMTSIGSSSSRRHRRRPSASASAKLNIEGEPIVLPASTMIDEDDRCEDGGDDEKIENMKKDRGNLTISTKTSIFRGFHTFPFHSSRKGPNPSSPITPIARTPISPIQFNQYTRATVHARFRLFKSAPKRTKNKNNRRPPPLNLQSPPKVIPVRRVDVLAVDPAIKLDTSQLPPEHYNFNESPEAGVQLLSQTLNEENQEKEEIFQSYSYLEEATHREEVTHREEITPIYLASPWFTASRRPSPLAETTTTKFPNTYLPIPSNIFESIPTSPVFSPLPQKRQQEDTIVILVPEEERHPPKPASPVIQPPTPRSTTSSFLFDEGEETDIEDSPALIYTKKPSAPNSRKSSVTTFFCRGQRTSFDRRSSIGLGGLTGDEVEIKDDAESVYYPGITELKSKSSWLYNNAPEHSSSSDEEDDSEIEDAYQKHLSLITRIHRKSTASLTASITSTPELMMSSVSSTSSYGHLLATPPKRRSRRRTASSECIVLEALEQMQAAGIKDLELVEEKSKGLGFMRDIDVGSEWAETFWEMDADEQVAGWDWETQQISLIGI